MKKKLLTVLLATCCAAAAAGCSSKKTEQSETTAPAQETAAARVETEAAVAETEAAVAETEAAVEETEAAVAETEAAAVETEAAIEETEEVVEETEEAENAYEETEYEYAETEDEYDYYDETEYDDYYGETEYDDYYGETEYDYYDETEYDYGETEYDYYDETEYDYDETEEEIQIIPKPVIAIADYFTLEDDTYKNLTVEVEPAEQVTDEEVQSSISDSFYYLEDYEDLIVKKTEGTVQEGDTANIDYVGTKDGVAFDGGTASGYDLTIGSGSFIPGFEDGLIGKEIGDTVDLNLTFPEEYGVEELNGADVVFTVTINYVAEMPELTDELAEKLSDGEYTTAKEYEESVRSELQAGNDESYQNEVYSAIMDKLLEEYPIENYPEEGVNYYEDTIIANYIEPYAQMYGMELEEFVSAAYGGLTLDELKEQEIVPEAQHMTAQELILGAIAEKEGLTMTDEELNDILQSYADQYGMTVEDLLGYEDIEYVRTTELDRKVMEWLAVNVNVENTAPSTEEDYSVVPDTEEEIGTTVETESEA